MFTLSDSRDIGCPTLASADEPEELHAVADAMGIPEECRIILSEPMKTVMSELFPIVRLPENLNGRITPGAITRPHGGI